MSNDINIQNTLANTRLNKSGKSAVESRKAEDTVSGSPASGSAASESVTVSSQLTRVAELSKKLADMPAVDMQKVAEIKQALADGSLQIDAEKVAESLLQFESGNVGSGKGDGDK